jgi:hypothetical protein
LSRHRDVNWCLLLLSAAVMISVTIARQARPIPSPLALDCTYGWQNRHERQFPNSTFYLFNLYKHGSVFNVRFHRSLSSSPNSKKNFSQKIPTAWQQPGTRYFGLDSPSRFLWCSEVHPKYLY